jgi:hypothetical protein
MSEYTLVEKIFMISFISFWVVLFVGITFFAIDFIDGGPHKRGLEERVNAVYEQDKARQAIENIKLKQDEGAD